jgi:hypothetical protein
MFRAEAKDDLARNERDFDLNDQALEKGGREWSMAGQARKALVRQDYSLAEMVQDYKATTGKEPTPEIRAKLETQSKRIAELETQLAQKAERDAKVQADASLEKLKRDAQLEVRRAGRRSSRETLDAQFAELSTAFSAKLNNRLNANPLDPELISIITRMAKNRVLAGVNTVDGLVDEIHSKLKDYVDDKREIRDAISGYGQTSEMKKDELSVRMRDLKRQMKLVSAIEDAESGQRPARSGLRRETESQKVSELRRQLNEELKRQGMRQAADPLPAAKKRLESQIADIEKQLEQGARNPRVRRQVNYDQQAKELKAKRDALKAQLDEQFPPEKQERDSLPAIKTRLQKSIAEYERKIREADFAPKTRRETILDRQGLDIKAQLDKVKREFEVLKYRNSLTRGQKVRETLTDLANLPRSLKSSVDLSAPRQAAMWLVSHPAEGAKLFFGKQLKAMKEVNYDRYAQELKADPDFDLMERSGLAMATTPKFNAKLSAREEAFVSRIAGRIPGVSHSERAYTTFIDTARVSWFKQLKAQAEQAATQSGKRVTPEQYKAIAKFVNLGTGRGDLGRGTLNSISPVLNSIFFAPRYAASKIQVFDPRVYSRLPEGARKMAVRQAVQYFGAVASVALMLKYGMNQNVGTNPDDSDFGKMVIGNTHYDLTNGQGQYFTLAARLFKNAQNKIQGKSDDYGKSAADNIIRFLRYKLAPLPAAALNTLQGRNAVGEETSAKKEALDLITPLFLNDMYEAYKDSGATGILKAAPGFVGMGVQTYSPKAQTGRRGAINPPEGLKPPPPPKHIETQ